MKKIQNIGKFYTRIIMKNIGIFIFIGLLFVVFHDHGWFPNEDIYAISQLVYSILLPTMIAYEGGRLMGDKGGGVLAVLAVSGVLVAEPGVGILGGMLLGPLSGMIWKYEAEFLEKRALSSIQMLGRNLCIGITGGALAAAAFYLLSPALAVLSGLLYQGVNFLVAHRMTGILSIVIEPLKIFFLNNMVNHAILVPLGMGQVQEAGSSVLFLLEANPGPGIGVLAALCVMRKKRRSEYISALAAEAVGGIHEVYFPFVLSELRLLIPLILGGMAGNFCFVFLDAGLQGVVSPGSVFVILLMAGKGKIFAVLAGMCLSALVSFAGSVTVLHFTKEETDSVNEEKKKMMELKKIEKIAFVCDGGMGSSAMGAALFRRTLAKEGITGIQAEAFASDLVPEGMDMIVCQKDYYRMLPPKLLEGEVYTVQNLVSTAEYQNLIEQIQKRNG